MSGKVAKPKEDKDASKGYFHFRLFHLYPFWGNLQSKPTFYHLTGNPKFVKSGYFFSSVCPMSNALNVRWWRNWMQRTVTSKPKGKGKYIPAYSTSTVTEAYTHLHSTPGAAQIDNKLALLANERLKLEVNASKAAFSRALKYSHFPERDCLKLRF
ncbi:hypothetical protein F2P81_008164 [Scophthalmus maximus]|uniref:Uncharacterized protein n=1 Tax=Scophthalmus maximus TaxID=52904 RepID=A0A6A4T4T9_SCOMX|nr:hypothetical protein F2P81_008164 [Scophthalmus maximus]